MDALFVAILIVIGFALLLASIGAVFLFFGLLTTKMNWKLAAIVVVALGLMILSGGVVGWLGVFAVVGILIALDQQWVLLAFTLSMLVAGIFTIIGH